MMKMTSEHFLSFVGAWRSVLWPDFAEHDGCVFRAKLDANGERIYRDWLADTTGDRQRVEAVMNHLHIADVLKGVVESPSQEVVLTFGRLMRDLWKEKLSKDFPSRKFVVSFPEEHTEYVEEYEITFYQTI